MIENLVFQEWSNRWLPVQLRYDRYVSDSPCGSALTPLHWHEYYELEYVVSGQYTHIVNGLSYDFSAGSLSLLSPNDFHRIVKGEGRLTIYKLLFMPSALSQPAVDALSTLTYPICTRFPEDTAERMNRSFSLLSEIYQSGVSQDKAARFRLQNTAETILSELFTQTVCPSRQPAISGSAVGAAVQYINAHITEPLSVGGIAGHVYLTPDYLGYLFKKQTSMTIVEYVIHCRIRRACCLLSDSHLTVEQIAEAVGYRSLSLFYRHFKRCVGEKPTEWRK